MKGKKKNITWKNYKERSSLKSIITLVWHFYQFWEQHLPENTDWNWWQDPPHKCPIYRCRNLSYIPCLPLSFFMLYWQLQGTERVRKRRYEYRFWWHQMFYLTPSWGSIYLLISLYQVRTYLTWSLFLYTPICTHDRNFYHNFVKMYLMGPSLRSPLWYHSVVCIENYLFIVGIGPIRDKKLICNFELFILFLFF